MQMGDQGINNNIKCNIHKKIGREITSRVVDYHVLKGV